MSAWRVSVAFMCGIWTTEWCWPPRVFAITTKGQRPYHEVAFQPGDALLFGPETRGLPAHILDTLPPTHRLRIPMLSDSRSLNLSNAVAVVVYEAWRQQQFHGAQ
jgi:tRNA (cytidine/uridine-2'-O-)-methyltransferase